MEPIHLAANSRLIRFIRTFHRVPANLNSCTLWTAFGTACFSLLAWTITACFTLYIIAQAILADVLSVTNATISWHVDHDTMIAGNVLMMFIVIAAAVALLDTYSVRRVLWPVKKRISEASGASRLRKAWKEHYCTPVVIDGWTDDI